MHKKLFGLCFLLLITSFFCACSNSTTSSKQNLTKTKVYLPPAVRLGIAPFSQPTAKGQLISGTLPAKQGRIATEDLHSINKMLLASLNSIKRKHKVLYLPSDLRNISLQSAANPSALPLWMTLGEQNKLDYLLVPLIIDWHQRDGGRAGVKSSAHIRAEFYLLDIHSKRIFRSSIFEEKQQGLVDDLTKVGAFFQRGGSWITAQEMTQEAINQAIQEMGL